MNELTAMENYAKLKFIDFFGTDKQGQHIFAIYACRLPEKKDLNGTTFIEYVTTKYTFLWFEMLIINKFCNNNFQIYNKTNGTICSK